MPRPSPQLGETVSISLTPPFARLFWVDADPSNAASLRAHRQDFPNRAIDVFEADANEVINVILDGVPVTQPALAFLDPKSA